MQWLSAHASLILSVAAALLSSASVILHALHKDSVASVLDDFEVELEKLKAK